MSNHTPEPWRTTLEMVQFFGYRGVRIEAGWDAPDESTWVAFVWGEGSEDDDAKANADRIVACVNALADRDPARLVELEAAIEATAQAWEDDSPLQSHFIEKLQSALAAFRTPVAKAEPTQENKE